MADEKDRVFKTGHLLIRLRQNKARVKSTADLSQLLLHGSFANQVKKRAESLQIPVAKTVTAQEAAEYDYSVERQRQAATKQQRQRK
jgi:hypothetical protein